MYDREVIEQDVETILNEVTLSFVTTRDAISLSDPLDVNKMLGEFIKHLQGLQEGLQYHDWGALVAHAASQKESDLETWLGQYLETHKVVTTDDYECAAYEQGVTSQS